LATHYTEVSAVNKLKRAGVNFKNKVIEAKKYSLGIGMLGAADYLCKVHKYVLAFK